MSESPVDREAIHAYLTEKIGGDRDLLPPDGESLVDAGILDSFGLAELVAMVEEQFGVKVPEADIAMQTFENVDLIVKYVESQRGS